MIIGVGSAYISSGIVQKEVSIEYIPMVIALIAMTAEKIGQWVIYKLNVDNFLTALSNMIFDFILNLKVKK